MVSRLSVKLSRVVLLLLCAIFGAAAAHANNTFPGTTISGASSNLSASTVGATGETGEPVTFGGGSLNTMWYSWTAPGNGTVTFETCGNPQTTFDTTLQSFTGTAVNALTLLAQNDDTTGCATTVNANYGSRINWNVTQGTSYRIQVDGYGSATGTFRLAWSFTGFTVTKSVSAASVSAPGTLTYTISVANVGAAALTGATITDSLLLGAAARTLTSGPTLTSGDSNSNSQIDTTETWNYTATYAVPQADIDLGGTYSNTATFDTTQTNAYTSNAATTTIVQSPSFTHVKAQSAGPSPVTAAGQTITYTLTIDNTGNTTLTAPTLVSDTFQLGGSARTLTSGPSYTSGDTDTDGAIDTTEIWIYTATYVTTQSDIDGTGNFTNVADFDTAQTAPVTSNTVTTNVTRTPNFTIAKTQSGGPNPVSAVGQTITYTITIVNTGNQSLTSPAISDTLTLGASARSLSSGPTLTAGDAAPAGVLNVGETWTYTATYVTTQADFDGTGNFSNTATFSTTQVAAKSSSAVVTTVTRSPSFTNVKAQASGPSPVTAAGQTIGYSITIANSGNQTLTGLTISDTLQLGASARTLTSGPTYSSGDTDSDGAIDVGESWVYAASYVTTQADIDGTGSFTNTATFDTTQTAPLASNIVTTNVTRSPNFSISKAQSAGPSPVTAAGQTITYTITVVNTGNQSLTSPAISDTLTLGASARTLTSGPTLTSGDAAPAGILNVGETWIYTATYVTTQADIDGTGSFSNAATFSTTEVAAKTSSTVVTNVTRSPSFTNVKAQATGPNPITAAGQTVTYTISIANSGNQTLTGLTISDTLQVGASARTLTSGPVYSSGDTDSDGAIDLGETWVYAASYVATQADLDATGSLTNSATFDTAQTAPVTSNTVTTNFTRSPDFSISKAQSAGPSPVTAAGQTITYTITIANTGNQSLTTPAISDVLTLGASSRSLTSGPSLTSGDAAPAGVLNVGETWIYTATYVTTQADFDATGNFSNTATFSTTQVAAKSSAAVVTAVTRTPSFTVAKGQTGGPNPVTAAGQTIGYTVIVTNTGNQTLTGQSITDTFQLGAAARSLAAGPSYSSGDTDLDGAIDVGEVWLYAASYVVPQADMDGTGDYTNVVTYDTAQTAPQTSNTVTTTIARNPALSINKSWAFANPGDDADADGFADLGDLITYYYDVTNTGNVTITGVSVNDVHSGYGSLSAISPASVASLAPTASTQFTSTYLTVQGDIDNP